MKLYHSSTLIVRHPEISFSRPFLDFGKGFYLTSIHEQAIRYGQRFIRRRKNAWLNVYELEITQEQWHILQFDSYNKDWLDFVSKCRVGQDNSDFDMVIGGIANDKVVETLDRYFEGEISRRQALGLLRYEKPNIQYCIRSQKMLDTCLKHIESELL